jgi:hypothetical protein
MINKKNNLNDLISELFLIIGGFILAQTIINQFISLSSDVLSWWVLPLFSILLIIIALDFRNQKNTNLISDIISILSIGGSILLIVLMKNDFITKIFFLFSILFLYFLCLIVILIKVLLSRSERKIKRR